MSTRFFVNGLNELRDWEMSVVWEKRGFESWRPSNREEGLGFQRRGWYARGRDILNIMYNIITSSIHSRRGRLNHILSRRPLTDEIQWLTMSPYKWGCKLLTFHVGDDMWPTWKGWREIILCCSRNN